MNETLRLIAPLAVFIVVMYFMVIRPQTQQQKQRQQMLESITVGSKIRTIGGMYGTIDKINGDEITLRVADNVQIRMARFAVESIIKD